MRLAVTRPLADSDRTAGALRTRGHEVLVAPLMRLEPVTANLSGNWAAVVITSANAPAAIASSAPASLLRLPLFAVGQRSAEAARAAGFANVTSTDGDVRDLVQSVAARSYAMPVLYLAGEYRAADLIGALAARGVKVEMRVVYRAVTAPFPPELVAALRSGALEAVLHFSRRSADNYLTGARDAGLLEQALGLRHFCLSAQIAEPLVAAGAAKIAVAQRPDEAALLDLAGPAGRA